MADSGTVHSFSFSHLSSYFWDDFCRHLPDMLLFSPRYRHPSSLMLLLSVLFTLGLKAMEESKENPRATFLRLFLQPTGRQKKKRQKVLENLC